MWIKGDGMLKQHVVGAELVLSATVTGKGDDTNGKGIKHTHQCVPTNPELALESAVPTGRASLEALRCPGLP